MESGAPMRHRRDVTMTFVEWDANLEPPALVDLVTACRRSGASPGTLLLLAASGDIAAVRVADGSCRFDRDELDGRFGVHRVRVDLTTDFW
jgi:hypothetical protein